jgi:putative heme-binding domain-containing protein
MMAVTAEFVRNRDLRNVYCGFTMMKGTLKWLASVLVACTPLLSQNAESASRLTAEDFAQGERTYGSECSFCHGPKGEGAVGPVLAVPGLRHAPTDQALFQVIREGIPGTQMPSSPLPTAQIWQLVAYVRRLGHVEQGKSAGDAKLGERVYHEKGGCAQCHSIAGLGGAVGPDLSNVGARMDRDSIRASLITPEASVPRDFLQVRVVTKDGQRLTGVRVNEDSFSIQIRDLSNHSHSFWKTELSEVVKEPNRSPMPSYSEKLTPEELDNLIAYLESLQR